MMQKSQKWPKRHIKGKGYDSLILFKGKKNGDGAAVHSIVSLRFFDHCHLSCHLRKANGELEYEYFGEREREREREIEIDR